MRAEIAALDAQRAALRYYFADLKAGLTGQRAGRDRDGTGASWTPSASELEVTLAELRDRETRPAGRAAGHGGNRLAEIERQLAEVTRRASAGWAQADRFAVLLADADLSPVETAEQFAVRRREITAARAAASRISPISRTR